MGECGVAGGGYVSRKFVFCINHPGTSCHPSKEGNFYFVVKVKIPRLGQGGLLER